MKRKIIYILAAVIICLTVFTLAAAYLFFPQDRVVFDDNEYTVIDDFDIRINQAEKVDYTELPVNVNLNRFDAVTMTALLKEPSLNGASLFFKTSGTTVSVTVDGEEIYTFGKGKRLFGRALFRVWHFVELPSDYASKEIVITQQMTDYNNHIPTPLYWVGLSTKATALTSYFYPTYGFTLYLAVTMAVISLGFIVFSLILLKNDKKALKIFYFFLLAFIVSIWGICDNSMITLFFGNSYFIYCLSFILQSFFLIPAMLYLGKCYHERYKKIFDRIIMIDLIKLLLLLIFELTSVRTFVGNLHLINAFVVMETLITMSIILKELFNKNEENRFLSCGLLIFALFGMFETVRLYVFHKDTITTGMYYGMAIILTAGAVETVRNYFREADDIMKLKAHGEETMRLLDIQQGYYERISAQLNAVKQAAHDFKQLDAIIYAAVRSGSTKNLERLLEQTGDKYKNLDLETYTDCMEINSIISFAAKTCNKRKIKFTPVIRSLDCEINLYDLCIIIGNMVDNAVEGASGAEDERFVTLVAGRHEDTFLIRTENSYSGELNLIDGKMATTKRDKDFHGMGLSIIEEILKKYGGELLIESEGNVFKAVALIPDNGNQSG